MAKKRKPAAKAATRRTPRRGKQAAATADGGAPSESAGASTPTSAPDAPAKQPLAVTSTATSEQPPLQVPQTSKTPLINPNLVPTVVLHKKFGKYRCLFNSDTFSKKYDLGSDSETSSSIEIKVVDPGASSESDSNAALDTQSDTNSGACNSPVDPSNPETIEEIPEEEIVEEEIPEEISRESSPSIMLDGIPLDIPLPSDDVEITDKFQLDLVPLPPPREIEASGMSSYSSELCPVRAQPFLFSTVITPAPNLVQINCVQTERIQNEEMPIINLDDIPEPEPVKEYIPDPDPIKEYIPKPDPIIEYIPEPDPIKEYIPKPDPIKEYIPKPDPIKEYIPKPDPIIEYIPEPDPIKEHIPEPDPIKEYIPEPDPIKEHIPEPNPIIEYTTADEETQFVDGDDDEEVITVVQIVEDDHPELYYNINMDSLNQATDIIERVANERKKQDADFQKHFEQLNIATSLNTGPAMEISEVNRTSPCGTPDLLLQKDNLDLARPDPSLTPSSTLSDDSNSSRVAEQGQNTSNDSSESSPSGVRRSNRIKTISNMKQKTKGYGLVKTPLKKALITQTKLKLEELGSESQDKTLDSLPSATSNSPSFPVPFEMPVKVKSRWRRSSELEMGAQSPASSPLTSPGLPKLSSINESPNPEEDTPTCLSKESYDRIIDERMRQFEHLEENDYLCERMVSRDTKKMICDCFMTKEELERGELACGEDCLNRLLMIECNSRCPVGDRCTNRRFQTRQNATLKVFYADKKGCGVEASTDIPAGEFLMEYIGEVLDYDQFYKRAQAYSEDNNLHHYFMSLKGDTVIDATLKGNISRFINHSCDPNAETQKWTVNGELRIGFFSKRDIPAGEEITFDYQFQRFGKVAQRCYCGADACRGWIGAEPDSDDEDEEEEEDVSTSKDSASLEAGAGAGEGEGRPRARRPRAPRKYKPKAKDLVQDADIEEDLEALSRTGVKNQSHTLRLSRTIVRAKTRRCQTALLRLLRDADLPCRRLFLDYRGLRLLAPWCTDAPLDFRLEMLQTVDRLPIPNKTLVSESRFITLLQRWRTQADAALQSLKDNVFIDETTGLPVELPNRLPEDGTTLADKTKENTAILEKIKDLSSQLIERWSSLKEVFKIPKKERIQQMKEHERQANVERRAADSSGARDRDRERRDERERERERERDRERERERERERDRYRERERERERERDRDREREERDRRKRRNSPDGGRRSIRLSERVLAAVPPMSKEERRRAFAEAAAAAEESRRQREHFAATYWPQEQFAQMGGYPSMMPPNMLPMGVGGLMGGLLPPDAPPDWRPPGELGPPYYQPFPGAQAMCMPQPNMGVMNMPGYGMPGFMFGQQLPAPFPAHPAQQPPPHQPPQLQGGVLPPGHPMNVQAMQQQAPPQPPDTEPKEIVLPSLWRSAEDNKGRVYYYHVKLRQPQWHPPPPPPEQAEESSSEEEEEALVDDVVRMPVKGRFVEGVNGIYEVIKENRHNGLIPEHAVVGGPRKRRPGLVSERPISPRTEEDKLAGRLEVKRYKQTKEKLRRRREKLLQRVRVLATAKPRRPGDPPRDLKIDLDSDTDSEADSDDAVPVIPPLPVPEPEPDPVTPVIPIPTPMPVREPSPPVDPDEVARKIKEQFRSAMARVMVQHLNPYRHSEAKAGRITCTADFKHLARKLTHFVMLKELKHCRSVEELVVTESVRGKAKMFVKKYMAKFGPVYRRPPEEVD